jgi:hypothetical protein
MTNVWFIRLVFVTCLWCVYRKLVSQATCMFDFVDHLIQIDVFNYAKLLRSLFGIIVENERHHERGRSVAKNFRGYPNDRISGSFKCKQETRKLYSQFLEKLSMS